MAGGRVLHRIEHVVADLAGDHRHRHRMPVRFSMWPPAFATDQFLGLASFARADSLVVGALLAQRERTGGWGQEVKWAAPAALISGTIVVAIRLLEKHSVLPLLTYNLK